MCVTTIISYIIKIHYPLPRYAKRRFQNEISKKKKISTGTSRISICHAPVLNLPHVMALPRVSTQTISAVPYLCTDARLYSNGT